MNNANKGRGRGLPRVSVQYNMGRYAGIFTAYGAGFTLTHDEFKAYNSACYMLGELWPLAHDHGAELKVGYTVHDEPIVLKGHCRAPTWCNVGGPTLLRYIGGRCVGHGGITHAFKFILDEQYRGA